MHAQNLWRQQKCPQLFHLSQIFSLISNAAHRFQMGTHYKVALLTWDHFHWNFIFKSIPAYQDNVHEIVFNHARCWFASHYLGYCENWLNRR